MLDQSEEINSSAPPFVPSHAYFVTLYKVHEARTLSSAFGGRIHLNDLGEKIRDIWKLMPDRFPNLRSGNCVILPDRIHCVVYLSPGPHNPDLNEVIQDFMNMVDEEYALIECRKFSRIGFRRSLLQPSYSTSVIKY
jgi:hypothetical protein